MAIPEPPGPQKPPPISRRVVLVAGAVLVLTLTAIVADGRRARTGELLVQSGRGDLRVTIRRGGRAVEGPTGRRSFTLPPGVYDVEIDGAPGGRVSVIRGERTVLRIAEPSGRARTITGSPSPSQP